MSVEEDDFARAQERLRARNKILLVVIIAGLVLVFPLVMLATSWLGTAGYLVAVAPMLVGYGIVRTFLTRGRS